MYGDGMQVRDWLHVSDHAAAIEFVLRHGESGEAYNVAGDNELPNREVIGRAAATTGRRWSLVRTRARPPGPRPALRDGRLEARRARLAAAGRVRATGCPRRSPGTASTPTGGRPPGPATGTRYYERQYGDRLAPPADGGRRQAGGLTDAGRGHRAPAGGSAGRSSEALEDAPFTGHPRTDRAGRARSSTSTRSGRRFVALLERDRPEVVIHAAAWTDVDGCARDPGARDAPQRRGDGGCSPRPVPRAASTSSSSRPTRCSTARRTDGRGYAPSDAPTPDQRVRGEQARRGDRRHRRVRGGAGRRIGLPTGGGRSAGPQLAIVRTAWLLRAAGQRLPGQDRGRGRARGRGRRTAAGRRRRDRQPDLPPTWPTRSSSCSRSGAPEGIHHFVNGGVVSRAGWAREVLGPGGGEVADRRGPGVDLGARLATARAGACSSRRRCPSGEPMRPWQEALADDLPWRVRARAGAPVTAPARWRPAASAPVSPPAGVGSSASSGTAIRAARSGRSGGRAGTRRSTRRRPGERTPRFVQANVSTSAVGVLRGLHLHRRQLDHWVVLEGRAIVALVDVRPMLAGAARPSVETHELGGGRPDRDPGRRRPRLPRRSSR